MIPVGDLKHGDRFTMGGTQWTAGPAASYAGCSREVYAGSAVRWLPPETLVEPVRAEQMGMYL